MCIRVCSNAEGRWLHNETFLDDYALFFSREGNPRQYSFWFANSVQERAFVTSSLSTNTPTNVQSGAVRNVLNPLVGQLLPGMLFNFETIKTTNFDKEKGLYFNTDNRDGMEFSVGGGSGGNRQCFRPTLNSYMIAEARALAKFLQMRGQLAKSKEMQQFASMVQANMDTYLWDNVTSFYKVLPRKFRPNEPVGLVDVKELIGYTPWYFGLVSENSDKNVAWAELQSSNGFKAKYGLTTCMQRHPKFSVAYSTQHECQWNGPVWPYATSMTLTALAKHLQASAFAKPLSSASVTAAKSLATPEEEVQSLEPAKKRSEYVSKQDFFEQLQTYARSHSRVREVDNKTVAWIDENLHPSTGVLITASLTELSLLQK
jgi:hypothetical protein